MIEARGICEKHSGLSTLSSGRYCDHFLLNVLCLWDLPGRPGQRQKILIHAFVWKQMSGLSHSQENADLIYRTQSSDAPSWH